MSAAATPANAGAAPAKAGKKKLIIIIVAVLVLALGGGGAALFMMKSKAAAAAEGEEEAPAAAEHASTKVDPKHPPNFLPLDPFVVNLADKDADRFAQIGITLQIDKPEFADQMKAYMPAVRNAILMILAHKTSKELLDRDGKEALAAEIMREAVRPMGIDIDPDDEDDDGHGKAKKEGDAEPKSKKKKKRKAPVHNPVQHVHFSNFVIQ